MAAAQIRQENQYFYREWVFLQLQVHIFRSYKNCNLQLGLDTCKNISHVIRSPHDHHKKPKKYNVEHEEKVFIETTSLSSSDVYLFFEHLNCIKHFNAQT